MLRSLRSRRRPRYGAHLCAVISALLLLISLSLLHTRLSSSHYYGRYHHHGYHSRSRNDADSAAIIHQNPLLSDSDDNSNDDVVDKIDEHDTFEDQNDSTGFRIDDEELSEGDLENGQTKSKRKISSSGYFVDHITGSIRRALNKRSIDDWDYDYNSFSVGLNVEDQSKDAFGSDDIPIDEHVRRKVNEVDGIEDALLLKIGKRVSPLREGWGDWFDKKSDFLRRDRMFKSNLEMLNPLNNPFLQDPDGVGVTGLTRGDKVLQKLLFNEFKKTPFLVKKPLRVLRMTSEDEVEENGHVVGIRKSGDNGRGTERESDFKNGGGIKIAERRIFHENESTGSHSERLKNVIENLISGGNGNVLNEDESNVIQGSSSSKGSSTENIKDPNGNGNSNTNENSIDGELRQMENRESKLRRKSEELSYALADGKRWGYFPGLHPHLSFSDFMDSFFGKEKCDIRVFMVWNSPSWMYTVRHQRGLESLLLHHREACVVVLSETIELDFFADSFVKDGYKVAVAMPNLDELLKDTPTHVFADVWYEWKGTKFYPTHYSELIRLAALYKYGGIYLDSDIIVLNPFPALNNTVGLEDQLAGSSLNGAVMAFRKNSLFIMECLKEFYATYDDTQLRWNGADLLTRVARRFLKKEDNFITQLELSVQPSYIFFPIGSQDIERYSQNLFSNICTCLNFKICPVHKISSYGYHVYKNN
ncbi:hypothetical protein P3X46_020068 [Hevea brasiliensis]|uniref:Alpha 1,4-glycosyltransferase domain-containing protein n=2 Tax=Hevea brasiliensis TaxID=3981 RepID=A0ABQ9LPJ3_HEVBR|nr:hypothetical protein P3X46_020068 [Hevea brasiliensis]